MSFDLPPNLTLADITLALHTNHTKQQHTQHELQRLHHHRAHLIANIDRELQKLPQNITAIGQYTNNLLSIVTLSNQSTASLSNKIKQLDTESNRVKTVLNHVSTMVELRDTITLVEQAINENNLTRAAELIYRAVYVQLLPISYITSPATDNGHDKRAGVLDNNVTYQLLKNLEYQLYDSIKQQIEQSAQPDDVKQQLHYATLLGYINHTYDGCVLYCGGVTRQYVQYITSNGLLIQSQPANSVIPYTDMLSQHYESVAIHIKQHLEPLHKHFGIGTQIRLIQLLQEQIDVHVVELLQKYSTDRRISATIKQIRALQLQRRGKHSRNSTQHQQPDTPQHASEIDAKQLDNLLEEMTYILHESENYDTNIRKLAKHAKQQLHTAVDIDTNMSQKIKDQGYIDKDVFAQRVIILGSAGGVLQQLEHDKYGTDLIHVTKLNELTQQLISDYITLEEQYMVQNIHKAIQIDEHITDTDKPTKPIIADDDAQLTGRGSPNKLKPDSSREQIRGLAAVAGSMANVAAGTLAQTLQAQGVQLSGNTQQTILAQILLTGIGLYTPSITSTNAPLTVSPQFIKRFKASLTSTVADDLFYILKKSTERACQTSVNGAAAIINHINALLSTEYRPLFYTVFNQYGSRYSHVNGELSLTQHIATLTSAASNLQAAVEKKHTDDLQLLVALNNLDASIQHIHTLKAHLTGYTHNYTHNDNSVIQFGLVEMDNTANEFVDTYKSGMDLLVKAIMFRLRPALDTFTNGIYSINEATFVERSEKNVFVTLFTAYTSEAVVLQKCMTSNNYCVLVHQLIQQLNTRVEQVVGTKQFNFWGGLLLDAQVRQLYQYYLSLNLPTTLSPYLTTVFAHSVNTLFNRLKQISLLLSCETVREAGELWQNTSETWTLRPTEVKTVLKYRTDFSVKEIDAIKL